MQILAGELKGQKLEQPKSDSVRPLSQKARAAIFDILGSIGGLMVLDLYAGSGAAGLEALSRGAAHVVLIESNRSVAAVIERNAKKLEVSSLVEVINKPVGLWLAGVHAPSFDVAIADPPYADLKPEVLDQIATALQPSGILVVSHSSKISPPELKSFESIQSKHYGDSALSFYRKV